jgi:hypothetical protein
MSNTVLSPNWRSPLDKLAAKIGDVREQYNVVNDTYDTWRYDGIQWNLITSKSATDIMTQSISAVTGTSPNYAITGTTITSSANTFDKLSSSVNTMFDTIGESFKKNLRVAEIYSKDTGKHIRSELQYRRSPGELWTPLERFKIFE